MRELIYTILELEDWNRETTCRFCSRFFSSEGKAVCQIRTRSKVTHKIISNDEACQTCKEKFENSELPKCERCGRLKNKSDIDVITGKYICRCIERKENLEEKELPTLPHKKREATFYERQINSLREEKDQLTEEVETHLEALEVSEVWNKRQKQELLDRIKGLEAENKRLRGSTPQELLDEIKRLKEEVEQLKEQNRQVAQVEVKSNKKSFLLFGRKS